MEDGFIVIQRLVVLNKQINCLFTEQLISASNEILYKSSEHT